MFTDRFMTVWVPIVAGFILTVSSADSAVRNHYAFFWVKVNVRPQLLQK